MKCKSNIKKKEEERREREDEIRPPYRVPKLQSSELVFFASPWSLCIVLRFGFSISKISKISLI